MNSKIILFFLPFTLVSCQTPCQSVYAKFNGTCIQSSDCTGAALTEICENKNFVCCIPDLELKPETIQDKFITLDKYLKFVGNSTRTRSLYYLLKKAIADAGITKCHAAASFFAQVLGESKSLTFFEELKSNGISGSIGNNETGDDEKYRGRGALLLRGKRYYSDFSREGMLYEDFTE